MGFMIEADLQAYLHRQIPLSAAMQVSVVSATLDSVVLSAPLAPNINHKYTAFGGSVSALGILAAWSAYIQAIWPCRPSSNFASSSGGRRRS